MKSKFVSAILALVLILSCITCYAADDNRVYCDSVTIKQSEEFTLPVKLENNSGIMGFRITVKYPKSQFTLLNLSSGSISSGGMFNSTITDYGNVDGSFDVLWNNTDDVKTDGTLFVLKFKAGDHVMNGEYNISITYSQADTFDSNFEDVRLHCSPAKVLVNDGTYTTETTHSHEEVTEEETTKQEATKNDVEISDDYLIDSVESALDKIDKDNLTDADKDKIVESVNEASKAFDENAQQFDSFDDLMSAYNQSLIDKSTQEIVDTVDSNKIIATTNKVLKHYGVDKFSDIPDDKKSEAVKMVTDELDSQGADSSTLSKIDDDTLATQALDELVSRAEELENSTVDIDEEIKTIEQKETKKENIKNNKTIIIVSVISLALVATILAVVIRKKQGGHKNEKRS